MDTGGDVPVDFISQFHNLEGDLIGQRKKHFFKLILNPSSFPNAEQVDYVLEHLQPTTYLESLFRIDILIHFKKTAGLIEVLKQGNEIFISKILKQPWFFNEAFRDVEAKQFVNEFLPCLSYAVRVKVVKQISKCWNEAQIDALFDSLSERYGIFLAKMILHKCSFVKFKEVLKDNEIRLHASQVKYIFDKDIQFFEFYLDYSNSLDNTRYQESKVLNHVALKNPALLLQLEKNKKVFLSVLGKRTSKRIMELVKDDVPKDHKRYFNLLNKSVLVRRLGGEFGKVYQQEFPKKKTDCFGRYSYHMKLLLLCPKRRRWDLFCETYLKNFPGTNIEGILSVADTSLLGLNPGNELVKKWALHNYNLDKGDDFLKYFSPSEAIPIIKEKINVTSDIEKRSSLVMLLLQNCATNNDLKALEEVLKYICFRHRNENQYFRQSLMRRISSDFKLSDLNENHWKYINEQLKIDRIRKEFRFWTNSTLLEKHLEFLFKTGKDHKDALVEYINDVVDSNSAFVMNLDNPPIEKQILTEICKLLPAVEKSKNFNDAVKNIVERVVDFSIKHPEYCIKLADFPTLISAIRSSLSKNEKFDTHDSFVIGDVLLYNLNFPENSLLVDDSRVLELFALVSKEDVTFFSKVFQQNVLKKNRSEMANEILNVYLQNVSNVSLQQYIIRWLLTNEPRRLIPYFDTIIKIDASALNSEQLKLYSHFEFDKKASAFYMKQLDEEDRYEKQIMENLVVLLSADEFVSLTNMFLPKKVKVDMEDEEMQRVYKLQCELAKVLHKVQEPSKILPLVMKFCVGDYLQSALPALYSVLYRVPEQIVPPCVDLLAKGAVSVRKHAIFLTFDLLDRERVLNVLKNAKQTNVSDQKHLFSATFNYFRKNPSREFFDAVIAGLGTIDRNDTEAIDSVVSCLKVPRKYLAAYVEKCWGWLEGLGDRGVQIEGYLGNLLNHAFVDVLKSFSSDFVRRLLTRYFGSKSMSNLAIPALVIKVLEYRVSERDENFALVFGKLPELDQTGLGRFFDCFMDSRGDENNDREFIDAFVKHWKEHFTGLHMFKEHITLKLFLIELDHQSSEDYARRVISLLEELVSQFGFHVFDIFKDQLQGALERLKDITRYSLYLDLLKYKCDPSTCILVMKLMERVEDDDDRSEVLKLYKEVTEILKNVNEPIVQIYYKSY